MSSSRLLVSLSLSLSLPSPLYLPLFLRFTDLPLSPPLSPPPRPPSGRLKICRVFIAAVIKCRRALRHCENTGTHGRIPGVRVIRERLARARARAPLGNSAAINSGRGG